MVTVPVLAGPVFVATEITTVPPPVPLEPLVTVIHELPLDDVQVQPVPDVTPIETVPPPDPTEELVEERV